MAYFSYYYSLSELITILLSVIDLCDTKSENLIICQHIPSTICNMRYVNIMPLAALRHTYNVTVIG